MIVTVPYGMLRKLVQRAALFCAALLLPAAAASAQAGEDEVHILAFGDSLTAGYGLPRGQGFAPQLEAYLRRNGVRAQVTDGGVSGDTAAAAQRRLGWTLDGMAEPPTLAIVALGGNDMLRALPPAQTRAALEAILQELRRRNIRVVLAGMLAPRNLGPDYVRSFEGNYRELAAAYDAELYPFFLEGVAGITALNLPDRIHPNFLGIKRIVSGIGPTVIGALRP